MIVYLVGNTFQQIVSNAITDTGKLVLNKEVSNEIDFVKYVKQSITALETVEILLIDISSCINSDEEIITALEMLRTMYDELRIIIFAPYRATGDEFLAQCFRIGILNIVNSDDFVEIKNEIGKCIISGKSFKEAVKYKDVQKENVIIKHEIKKTVNKKLVAVMGTEENIGVTHNCIVLANYFRKKGYMVAIAEMNKSGAFADIREDFSEREYEEGYFTLQGIDYFGQCDTSKLVRIMEHPYNFIILDYGTVENTEGLILEQCEKKIIVCGSRSWEYKKIMNVFNMYAGNELVLKNFIYCFNLSPKSEYEAIRKGMGDLKENVHFLEYTENPFESSNFPDADVIFAEYLPDEDEPNKKKFGLFGKRKKNEKATR